MDSGGWKVVYDLKPYTITDEGDYFAVHYDYKQIASYKDKALAFEYCVLKSEVLEFN